MAKKDLIRVGVIGVRRGEGFAAGAVESLGMKLVAICDSWKERLETAEKHLKVTTYTDYDKFLEHEMDAVILANFFHQHAPFAIKALKAGKHVMSETAACSTLAEGVELIDAVEKSGKIYMFAENYPYMAFNQEMRRLYQAGKVGTFMYGEGEYIHPMSGDDLDLISPGVNHWRNWIPATYYCTHALAPIMFITDSMPVKVNGFVMPWAEDNPVYQHIVRGSDAASMIAVRMDNGAVAKLLQVGLRGHGNWVRIHGSKGLMENLRTGDRNMLRVVREQYHEKRSDPQEMIYLPDFPEHHEEAMNAGHGGGDFFMNYHFVQAIRTGKQPYLDVYRGVTMACVGILAYRSALNDSNTEVMPDFHKRAERARYKNDCWTPDPARRGKNGPWSSIKGKITPSEKALVYAKKIWRKEGYNGD